MTKHKHKSKEKEKDQEINDLIDILFNDDIDKQKLMLLGFNEEDADNFLNMIDRESGSYLRVLTLEERESFTSDAIIYLLSLMQTSAITREAFEQVIAVCMQLVFITQRKCTKVQVNSILHFIVFVNKEEDYSIRDIMELFEDNVIDFDEEVH